MNTKTPMIKQLYSVPELMTIMEPHTEAAVKSVLETMEWSRYKKIIITGCGDSLCAGMAAKFAFMQYTSLDVEVTTVIDLARFYNKKSLIGNKDHLVVIISNSGHVARGVELAKRVTSLGGDVLAVTSNESSEIYKNASYALKLTIPKFDYAPGVRAYCGCLYGLYQLAIGIGEKTGVLSDNSLKEIRDELNNLPQLIQSYLELWDTKAQSIAESLKGCTSYELIGAGAHYATAWFGYAKALETTGKPSSALNTEDWFHMNYFIRDVYNTGTFLVINQDDDLSRAKEFVRVASEMGRPLICITDNSELVEGAKLVTPQVKETLLNTLIQYIPVGMVFSYIGDLLGEVYFRDGKDNWTACVDCATIINSEEIIVGE